MTTAREMREALQAALQTVSARFPSQGALAAHLGVSRKTYERYLFGRGNPPPARRLAIVRALAGYLDAAHFERFATALDVPRHHWPPGAATAAVTVAAPGGAAVEGPLDLALFAAAEAHGVHPALARQVVLDVLAKVVELGVDAGTARAAVAAVAARRSARGRG